MSLNVNVNNFREFADAVATATGIFLPSKTMAVLGSFRGRSMLTLLEYTPAEVDALLEFSAYLKKIKKAGVSHRLCEGKNVAFLFEKNSTRTRCAFEVAAADLGMHPVFLDPRSSQMGKKESAKDTARVLGRMFEGIEYRGFSQQTVELLAEYSGVPVWNGLTDDFHPTQVLADLLTMREQFEDLAGRKVVYLGDARYNMGNSLMIGCALAGMKFVAAAPKKYWPNAELTARCKQIASVTGGSIDFSDDPEAAVKGADILYTDVWVSMGEPESVWEERIHDLLPFRVTQKLMNLAGPGCKFMHCLPSFHNTETDIGMDIYKKYGLDCMEVTEEVFEGNNSIVFDQSENRLHTIKAVMAATMAAV